MRSLSELAEKYEMLAAEIEQLVQTILSHFSDIHPELLGSEAEQVVLLTHKARAYRRDAANLRAVFAR